MKRLKRLNSKKGGSKKQLQMLKTRSKRITWIKKIIGILLVLAVFGGCNYAVLVIAANSKTGEVKQWVKSYMVSFLQDIFTSELIKVFLNTVFIRALTRQPSRCSYKIMKLVVDPLIVRAIAMSNCPKYTARLQRIEWADTFYASLLHFRELRMYTFEKVLNNIKIHLHVFVF